MAKRRGKGEGSVYLRADGRWAGVATVENGRRKFVYAKTQEAAIAKLRQIVTERERGLPSTEHHLFKSFAAEWLAFKESSVRPRTYKRYEELVRIHLVPNLGGRRIKQIAPTHMTSLYSELLSSGLSASTVRHVHVAARTMMQDALRWGYVHSNVVALARPPKAAKPDMTILTKGEVQQILRVSDQTPDQALWRLAVGTALRAGELLALRWSDIDLKRKELSVNHTLRDLKKGSWELAEPKSKTSRRKIGLTDSLVEKLRSHRARQNEQMLAMGKHYKDQGFVFTREDGSPMPVAGLKRGHFEPILREAGLPISTRVHDLRHTGISHALANGVPIADVSVWAGHANVAITLSLYAHALPEATKQTTEAVAVALGI